MNLGGMIGFAGLFSGSFWTGFRYQTPRAIQDQLKKQYPQLTVLLNEEEVIQEVKSGSNTKLQQFFASKLFEMIDYITVMPESDVHERGHKFPFVVAQILNCDSQIILDAFFKAPILDDQNSGKTNNKEDEEDANNLSQNEEFDNDGSSLVKKSGDSTRYQDEDEEDDNRYDQHEQEENDSGPLVMKDIQDDNEEDQQGAKLPEKESEDKNQTNEEVVAPAADNEAKEKEDQVKKEPQSEEEEEEEEEREDEQVDVVDGEEDEVEKQETENSPKQDQDESEAIFDQEEKALPSLQTGESTTCDTRQRYRFQYLSYLFKFLEQKQNRPSSPTSSIASETTTGTLAEEDNNATPAAPEQQEKKLPEDNELNNVLSGYFAKLVIHFVIKRPKEFFCFLSERPQCLYSMTQHLYSRAIADALMKILICENHGIEDNGMSLYQEMRANVIQKIINYMDVKNSSNGIQNAVNILSELSCRKPCFDIIVQPSTLESFFNTLFQGIEDADNSNDDNEKKALAKVPSIVTDLRRQGIRLVSSLMQQYRNFTLKQANKNEEDEKKEKKEGGQEDEESLEKQEKETFSPISSEEDDDDDGVIIGVGDEEDEEVNNNDNSQEIEKKQEDNEKKPEQAQAEEKEENKAQGEKVEEKESENEKEQSVNEPNPFIECIYEKFDNLIKFLNIKPFESIDTISGQVMQPFGAIRLSVIEIIVEAVRINEHALNNKIIESKILTKLLHFFGEYEWNSLLHFKLDLMFLHIINNHESSSELLHAILEQSHLIQYILQLAKADLYKLQNRTSREIERGFFPYILRIMEAIKRQSEKSTYIQDQIKASAEEWEKVWTQKIEPKQKKYAKQLGGVNPNAKKNQNNNDSDTLALPSSLGTNENKKSIEDDDDNSNNNKFSSFDKKGRDDDDDQDQDGLDNEPEQQIRNKSDDDDDEDQIFGQNQRYSKKMGGGGNRANMLNDQYLQRHRDLYVQTNNANQNDNDDQEEEDQDSGNANSFVGWNVDDPKTLLQKQQVQKSKNKKTNNNKKKKINTNVFSGSDLNQAFDSKRDEDDDFNFDHEDEEDENERSSGDFSNFEFNSLRNDFTSSSGGFGADEFGEFQQGEEFYDAKDSSDQIQNQRSSEEFMKKEQKEESDYNDFNFWKPPPQYDLSKLMDDI